MEINAVTIVGLGYIGLPTAAIFAQAGLQVTGIDINQQVVDTVNKGDIHIIEPLLADIVKVQVSNGNLKASSNIDKSDAFIIAVPTPVNKNSATFLPDLSHVFHAVREIAKVLEPGNLIVLESTSPVGTTENLVEEIKKQRPDLTDQRGKLNVSVAYCPERVLPGNIVHELKYNARIIGGIDDESALKAKVLYSKFLKAESKITDAKTAEMVKLTENASRDSQLAFANQLSILCDKLGVNVYNLIDLANLHPRVQILQPGTGVGGHCIAVDPWFLIHDNFDEAQFLLAGRKTNLYKEDWVFDKCKNFIINQSMHRVVCMGLSYKPDIDDLRESSSLSIAKRLLKIFPERISCCEPNIIESSIHGIENIKVDEIDVYNDLVLFFVRHEKFKQLRAPKHFLDFCGMHFNTDEQNI